MFLQNWWQKFLAWKQRRAATKAFKAAVAENCGWLKKKLMWDWHEDASRGYPGWEKPPGSDHPWFVRIETVKGRDSSSWDVTIDTDNWATAAFYTRDWTKSSLPFVDEGELYWSGFWFASEADYHRFCEKYAGRISTGEIVR